MISGGEILLPINVEDYKKIQAGMKESLEKKIVGFGKFAKVFKIDDMAIKQIFFEKDDEEQTKYIQREIANLESIKHPFIIKFRGAFRKFGKQEISILLLFIFNFLVHFFKKKKTNNAVKQMNAVSFWISWTRELSVV